MDIRSNFAQKSPGRLHIRQFSAAILAVLAIAAPVAMAETSTLKYFTWGGYDDPAFRQPYIAKYGSGPEFIFYGHPDEAFAKLQAGFQADVAHPCIHDVKKWNDAGLIQPIDTAKVQAWDSIIPALKNAPALMQDNQHFLVPWEWGASSVIYRTDKVQPAEQSFAILIDPSLKGKVAIVDAFDETYRLAAVLAGVSDPLNLKEEDYPKVQAMMRQLRDNARMIWSDPAQLEQAMASGEVVAAWGWPNSFKNLGKQGIPVAYMLKPKEKLVTWLCGFVVLKSAKAPQEEIYDFINALEDPQSGKALIENWGYGHANALSLKAANKADLDALGLGGDPNEFLANGNLLGPMPEEQRARLVKMWADVKAGG